MKKSILIVYPAMMIGGSTTSLLSILALLDCKKFHVDLLLKRNTGELLDCIPDKIHLLKDAMLFPTRIIGRLSHLINLKYLYHYLISKIVVRRSGVGIHGAQYLEMKDVEWYRNIPDEYDIGISFLEGDSCKFLYSHVKARRKIAWIHVDYKDGQFDPNYDRESLSAMDKIILVSDTCKKSFDQIFPSLASKSIVVENILAQEVIRKRAEEANDFVINKDKLNFVTNCRIKFSSKGLDRAVKVMKRLADENLLNNVNWYIIGDGPDMLSLKKMIGELRLEKYIFLLGMQKNPLKFMKNMSMFLLPSYWEGKPMAVTEALMLGLPVFVTNYGSASEQVCNGTEGMIVENSEDGIYQGLRSIIMKPDMVEEFKKNVMNKDYSNLGEFEKILKLIDE